MPRKSVTEVRFGRSHVITESCLDSVSRYADELPIHVGGTIFTQQFLDDPLKLTIVALSEVVIANPAFSIYEELRRPVFVVERLPNEALAVDRNGIAHCQITNGVFDILAFALE